jgi:PhoH-like ATPase
MPTHKMPAESKSPLKLFVLDTNVLMHDPTSLFRFEEHDVYLPMYVLEELDNNKKGMTEVARNARQASRFLDSLVSTASPNIDEGVPLQALGNKAATGRLFLQTQFINQDLPQTLANGKADNAILGVVMFLGKQQIKREIILVSKDINMRIKARALGLNAQDYFNDKVLEDSDLLYTGVKLLPADFWDKHGKDMKSGAQNGHTFYDIKGPLCRDFLVNEFVYQEAEGTAPFHAVVTGQSGDTAMLRTLTDYSHQKNAVWGVTARNREQSFVLNLLMNPEIDFVTLLGQAGTGKTLLTLAAGLMQTLETKRYSEIIITRVTVPVDGRAGRQPGRAQQIRR